MPRPLEISTTEISLLSKLLPVFSSYKHQRPINSSITSPSRSCLHLSLAALPSSHTHKHVVLKVIANRKFARSRALDVKETDLITVFAAGEFGRPTCPTIRIRIQSAFWLIIRTRVCGRWC